MNKIIILVIAFSLSALHSLGQSGQNNVVYIIDSVSVIEDLGEGDISPNDIADITVIRSKDTLNRLGYGQYDGAIYIFTKAYRNRPDSLKQIPSSIQMEKKNDVWFFHGVPYSGRFIDYYYSGNIEGEGTFAAGKVTGLRTMYYQNGKIKVERNYKDGLENGLDKEYYEDGTLNQKGEFLNGKEEGIWEEYYPNGQVKTTQQLP